MIGRSSVSPFGTPHQDERRRHEREDEQNPLSDLLHMRPHGFPFSRVPWVVRMGLLPGSLVRWPRCSITDGGRRHALISLTVSRPIPDQDGSEAIEDPKLLVELLLQALAMELYVSADDLRRVESALVERILPVERRVGLEQRLEVAEHPVPATTCARAFHTAGEQQRQLRRVNPSAAMVSPMTIRHVWTSL
jgi:hypothetical protein